MRVSVALLAGGMGVRAGDGPPKAFRPLAGRPLVFHSLSAFDSMEEVTTIRVAVPGSRLEEWDSLVGATSWKKYAGRVAGGSERALSVLAVLRSLEQDHPDVVLVHDSARPMVERKDVIRLLEGLENHDGAILTAKSFDTLWGVTDDGLLNDVVDRNRIARALTPQAFYYKKLREAYEEGTAENFIGTDDAAFVVRRGGRVRSVTGLSPNPKVTLPEDFMIVEALMKGVS